MPTISCGQKRHRVFRSELLAKPCRHAVRGQPPQILVEVAKLGGKHKRQDPERLGPATQSFSSVAACGIGVGVDIKAHASGWKPEGGEMFSGERRDHRHAGQHMR